MTIIGIGGLPRSGKDTLAEMLIERGFYGFSFGDFVRKSALKRHKDKTDPISVKNLTETSNWLRETHGPDVVLVEALKEYDNLKDNDKYKGIVLFSVRAPVEVDFILKNGGELIWVEASPEVRYERGIKNLRDGEVVISLEEFKRQESLQWEPQPDIPPEVQMNVSYVKSKATIIIENNQNSLVQFEKLVSGKLKDIFRDSA
jgi:dephospho-CoA kinase